MRLSHLFIVVSDLERARVFYVTDLGLDLLLETPGYLRVGGGGGFHLGIEEGDPRNVGAPGSRSSSRSTTSIVGTRN
jgi:catechol 2,3-dioxygenase-like lactoylglutathione lyase family enzyme